MANIMSCFTRHTPVSVQEAFQKSCNKAEKENRVSSSNLRNLLKSIGNSPGKLPLSEFRNIQKHTMELRETLSSQGSKHEAQKSDKILDAFAIAEQKLTPGAVLQRENEAKASFTKDISNALQVIKASTDDLKNDVKFYQNELNEAVRRLPTPESRDEAKEIISRGHYDLFGEKAAITDSLFPSYTENVESRNGYRMQRFDHPDKSLWTSLKGKCRALDKAKRVYSNAEAYQRHSANFVFNDVSNTGKVTLSKHQANLISFAASLRDQQ